MLIKMIDGGLVGYTDDCRYVSGCATCDYGSEYINEMNVELTKHRIYIKINQMYRYAVSEGQIIKLFLSEYNTIQEMTEIGFIDWFKEKLNEITSDIEQFNVTEEECLEVEK